MKPIRTTYQAIKRTTPSQFLLKKTIKKPKVITMDAYNTIYKPIQPLPTQYNSITRHYGVNIPDEKLNAEFKKCFKVVAYKYPNYGKRVGLKIEEFWKLVLERLYAGFSISGNNTTNSKSSAINDGNGSVGDDTGRILLTDAKLNEMISEIIEHFASKSAYMIFNDVLPFLQICESNGIKTCVASNADSQVTSLIVDEFHLGAFFKKNDGDSRGIYLSYDVGVGKPNHEFFEFIYDDLKTANLSNGVEGLKKDEIWHVGDEFEIDVVGALGSGMNAVLLDREGEISGGDGAFEKNGCLVVGSLMDLVDVFQLKR